MERNDTERSRSEKMLLRTVFFLAAIAFLMICAALLHMPYGIGRSLLLCAAFLPLAFSIFLLYLLFLARSEKYSERNFFLYDRSNRANRAPEELTAELVAERTMTYMALFRHGKALSLEALFAEENGAPECFKPLFCYVLLRMLSMSENDGHYEAFLESGKAVADTFSLYLSIAMEEELSRSVQAFIADYRGNVVPFRSFLRERNTYLTERMLSYTIDHIHEFD